MTLVTGTVQDLGHDGMEGTLWARPARFRSDGQVVLAPERKPYKITGGVVSAELAPGPAVLELQVGSHARGTFEVVIPEEDTTLADLLDTVFPWEPAQVSLFVAEREAAEAAKRDAEQAATLAGTAKTGAELAAQQTGQDRTAVATDKDTVVAHVQALAEPNDAAVLGLISEGADTQTKAALNATYGTAMEAQQAHSGTIRTSRNGENPRPLVTLIDDDGHAGVLTVLAPIMQARNIPAGVAYIGNQSPIVLDPASREQLRSLQDDHGWEIMSHTMNHLEIPNISAEVYDQDCRDFLAMSRNYGFNVQHIVYPYGDEGTNRNITARYFLGGFNTNTGRNHIGDIDAYAVQRRAIGSMMEPGVDTFAVFKTLVDEAKSNNEWLVLMTHIGAADEAGVQLIEDVLDYVISQGIDIVSPTEGMRHFAPVVQSGRKVGTSHRFALHPNGIVESTRYRMIDRVELDGRVESDPPLPDQDGRIAHYPVTGWSLGNGVVTEYGHASGWQRQEFRHNDGFIFVRRWLALSEPRWDVWRQLLPAMPIVRQTVTGRTIPPHETVNVPVLAEGARDIDMVVATPSGGIETGVTWNVFPESWQVNLRLTNTTNSTITLADREWKFRVISG